jgi:hypothetical protein
MSRKSDSSDLRIYKCGTRASPSSDAIHAFDLAGAVKTWMPGTKFTLGPAEGRTRVPGMTERVDQPVRNAMAPANDRGRSRTPWPSFPLLTIHWPSEVRPVIMPT